jgi:hypothetical protein
MPMARSRRENAVKATNNDETVAAVPEPRLNPNCVVCGTQNLNGLQLHFHVRSDGVDAAWISGENWESFRGTIHGGIVTAVLDEAMSRAVIARKWDALTVELRVCFRGRTKPGETLRVRGWVLERNKRKILAQATIVGSDGKERAHGWGTFLTTRVGVPS